MCTAAAAAPLASTPSARGRRIVAVTTSAFQARDGARVGADEGEGLGDATTAFSAVRGVTALVASSGVE